MGKSTTNILLGFLAGAAAGAIAGILFAPDKGSNTRKNIADKASKISNDLKDNLGDKVDNLKEMVTDFVDNIRGRVNKMESEVAEVKDQARQTVKSNLRTNETKVKP